MTTEHKFSVKTLAVELEKTLELTQQSYQGQRESAVQEVGTFLVIQSCNCESHGKKYIEVLVPLEGDDSWNEVHEFSLEEAGSFTVIDPGDYYSVLEGHLDSK